MYNNPALQKIRQHPILVLLAINILIGLMTFRDYGLSWDEPLFYDYAFSLGYAYSPREWFSGNFDLENAFGASGTDHANRGPAYLLLARGPVILLASLGLKAASAWHLFNFLNFQFGVYLLYRLSKRWLSEAAALSAAVLFSWQPMLWGHAFINPKDPPFLVFFIGAVCLGFEMVDELAANSRTAYLKTLFAAFFLGVATSIRVLGPLAGVIVMLYWLTQHTGATLRQWTRGLLPYSALSLITAYIFWPYLWEAPVQNFLAAFGFMSDNPTHLKVLFNGQIYAAGELPRRYLLVLLGLTLTEPVWILFIPGIILGAIGFKKKAAIGFGLISLWFFIPLAYVLLRKPPMYDGFRHFLFFLPPVFIICGITLEKLFVWIRPPWVKLALLTAILSPSIIGICQLHPYQYAYFNSLTGGAGGAFRMYETDYWLTCYKEALETYQDRFPGPATFYVNREAYIAQAYANDELTILERRGAADKIESGDLFLVNTRSNEDLRYHRQAPVVLEVGREGAIFCIIKQIP